MIRRTREHLKERLNRIAYITSELTNKISRSITKNVYSKYSISYTASLHSSKIMSTRNSISRQRIWCPQISSPKKADKRHRFSRFELNHIARVNKLPNVVKRGW